MLSYQHAYHAANFADVHKHAALAWMLDYMVRKDKPLRYFETHAGRGLYDLSSVEARKTGEAAGGIARAETLFDPDHPYRAAIAAARAQHGADAYPGSPSIAGHLLRPSDAMDLAELHPQEHAALVATLGQRAQIHREDGLAMARRLCPPTPARGLMLIDPSWEVKTEYDDMPPAIARLARAWPVGVIVLWYPILADDRHGDMRARLAARFPDAAISEVAPGSRTAARGLRGSGLFVLNPPWGFAAEAARLNQTLDAL